MTVVPIYAALLTLGYLLLALRVIALRRRYGVAVGDGRKGELRRAIRVHGNFAEYVPLALVLLGFMEWRDASAPLLHVLGAVLLIGRLMHALGVRREQEDLRFRTVGTTLTFSTLFVGAVYLLATSLPPW